MSGRKSRKRPSSYTETETPVEDGFLCGVHAVILEQKLGRARAEILAQQLTRNGGKRHSRLQADTTHVIVDNNLTYTKTLSLLKAEDELPTDLLIVSADWLSSCLTKGAMTDCRPFEVTQNIATKRSDKTHQNAESVCPEDAGSCTDFGSSTDTSPVKNQSGLSSSTTTEKIQQAPEGRYLYGWGQKKESPRKRLVDSLDDDSDYVDSGADDDDLRETAVAENTVAVDNSMTNRSKDDTASSAAKKLVCLTSHFSFQGSVQLP